MALPPHLTIVHPPHKDRVTAWLSDLHDLAVNKLDPADLDQKIAAIASLLAEDFRDPRVFCKQSLRFVSAEVRFFAAYADVYRSLGAWWKENRPALPALPPPEPPPRVTPDPVEHEEVHRLVQSITASLRAADDRKRAASMPAPPNGDTRTGHLSDGQLLAAYRALADAGDLTALTRVEMLQKKLATNIPQNIPEIP